MRYCSTRGTVTSVSFEEALFSGYAADGGLMMPESVPQISREKLQSWSGFSYQKLALEIASLFISQKEIPRNDLEDVIAKAYSSERFDDDRIDPIAHLKDGLKIHELFHGSTLAFKDLSLALVGRLYEYFVTKHKRHALVLVGTSGDTGSAAIHAVRGLRNIELVVMLPRGRTSLLQELQMTTVQADNVHVIRVDGTSDDLDVPIRLCFEDVDFVRKHGLCSVNSINWARIMIQTVHFFHGYLELCPKADSTVQFVIPTGACGNVSSGLLARAMGLPVTFTCAVNENDIVHRFISCGDLSMTETVTPTLASAMDIQMPYNCERMLWLCCGRDGARVAGLMSEFWRNNKLQIPADILQQLQLAVGSAVIGRERMLHTMQHCYELNAYTLCPHTATGVTHFYNLPPKPGEPLRLYIATASPAKFPEALQRAGLVPVSHPAIDGLEKMPTYSTDMEADQDWLQELKTVIEHLHKG